MVPYKFKVLIPSLGRYVSFTDINIRDFININKSILNNDSDEIVDCFNRIIDECCCEKGLMFTLIDKFVILLSIRASSVSMFCTLTIVDKDELINKNEFEHTLEINNVINAILEIPLTYQKEYVQNNIRIGYGMPLTPVKNVNEIHTTDYIHYIKHNDVTVVDHTNSRTELEAVVENIDFDFTEVVRDYAIEVDCVLKQYPIYKIHSPFDRTRCIIKQHIVLDFGMYELIKMLFTENLHNLYRSIYNFNKELNIQPQYVEQLIPVEKDLIWGYHIKDQRDAEQAKALNTKTGLFSP